MNNLKFEPKEIRSEKLYCLDYYSEYISTLEKRMMKIKDVLLEFTTLPKDIIMYILIYVMEMEKWDHYQMVEVELIQMLDMYPVVELKTSKLFRKYAQRTTRFYSDCNRDYSIIPISLAEERERMYHNQLRGKYNKFKSSRVNYVRRVKRISNYICNHKTRYNFIKRKILYETYIMNELMQTMYDLGKCIDNSY